jgi:hypothetical protein
VATVTVRIPESLLKRAQATTGQRDAASAVRRALEIATRDYELKAAARTGAVAARRAGRKGSSLHHCEGRRRASQAFVKEIIFTRRLERDIRA